MSAVGHDGFSLCRLVTQMYADSIKLLETLAAA